MNKDTYSSIRLLRAPSSPTSNVSKKFFSISLCKVHLKSSWTLELPLLMFNQDYLRRQGAGTPSWCLLTAPSLCPLCQGCESVMFLVRQLLLGCNREYFQLCWMLSWLLGNLLLHSEAYRCCSLAHGTPIVTSVLFKMSSPGCFSDSKILSMSNWDLNTSPLGWLCIQDMCHVKPCIHMQVTLNAAWSSC